ncbi:MAG: glycerate kinase [Bacteroidales bacterium]|nr:glycerate kinase [Bacteroidales bacterium]
MKTLLALDSFKGSLTAPEAVDAAASALAESDVCRLPLSDGGEGFTDCIAGCLGGVFRTVSVHDPLGRPIKARYALLEEGRIAVIETAAASGLTLLKTEELDPLSASSIGTGEMMQDAIEQGVEEIWTGLGGTAVMDCGAGLLEVLSPLPAHVRIKAFYDADVPLTGPSGAPAVFGPQKGADVQGVIALERRFREQAGRWEKDYGMDPNRIPGAGAAGGIGAALAICLKAEMHQGIAAVLEAVRFPERLAECGLVLTGEGKADRQTLTGKVPFGVLQATRRHAPGIPVVLLAGKVEDREELLAAGFDAVIQVTPEESLKYNYLDKSFARENIRRTVQDLPYFRD